MSNVVVNEISPPIFSMMLLEMLNPKPIPVLLVVKLGLKYF